MLLLDVNVLVHAFRQDSPDHTECAAWLRNVADGDQPFGLADLALSGFLRIVTHPAIFDPPSALERAIAFVAQLRDRPRCIPVNPGTRHWAIFIHLCSATDARGNAIPDAYLAALAIESGCEWVTFDRGFARFPGLRWRHPLDRA